MFTKLKRDLKKIFIISIIDLKTMFKTSALSWVWLIINPLLMVLMYWFSFSLNGSFDNGNTIQVISFNYNDFVSFSPDYQIHMQPFDNLGWVIIGVFTWTFIGSVLQGGSSATKNYSWMITKIGSPLSLPPIAITLSKCYVGFPTIILSWFVYMIVASTRGDVIISLAILQLPLMLILMFLFMTLWSVVVAPLVAISKDIYNLIFIIPMFLQWVSCVFLPINQSQFGSTLGIISRINPFYFIMVNTRGAIMSNGYIWNDWFSLCCFVFFIFLFLGLAILINKRGKKIVVDLI